MCEVANEINCIGLDNGTRKYVFQTFFDIFLKYNRYFLDAKVCKMFAFLTFVDFRFLKRIPNGCAYSAGIDYSTALLLSVFFGWLGIDRIYLGYYAIGLKFFFLECLSIRCKILMGVVI